MKIQQIEFRMLPLSELYEDQAVGLDSPEPQGSQERLERAIQRVGLLGAITVDTQPGGYRIVDGLRRYRAVTSLGIESALCGVFPALSESDYLITRFQLNNTAKPWPKKVAKAMAKSLIASGLLREDEVNPDFLPGNSSVRD